MTAERLDYFLSYGYFRMHQELFTCRYLVSDGVMHPVHWLRIDLARVQLGPKQNRLFRINAGFGVRVGPVVLSDEVEGLYATYRNSIDFDTHPSVEACLLNGATRNQFDTRMVEIRDNDRLIAVGVFDNGRRSIAGILNFYDPAYHRHSLGKFLMLLKMTHARQQQQAYYYPGYIVSDYPKFDYKLFACPTATEVFDADAEVWLPFSWETVARLANAD
jgi:leucyl-tRNA---protein transferase